jgi:hypothetical protein
VADRAHDGQAVATVEHGVRQAVEGCQTPEQLAWLNVSPFATANDAAPSVAAQVHGRDDHLAPLLTDVLRPRGGNHPLCPPGSGRLGDHMTLATRWGLCDRWKGRNEPGHDGHPHATARPRALRSGAAAGHSPPTAMPEASAERLTALHAGLVAALSTISGGPPTETVSYTAVGSDPAWAFVEPRAG